MSLLGIDIGSSFIKGGVLDLDSRQVGHIVRQPFPDPIEHSSSVRFEIDPRAIVAAVHRVVNDLLEITPDCEGLVFSGQMGGVILADREGQPLSNYLSWRDLRTTTRDMPLTESASMPLFFDAVFDRLGAMEFQAIGRELKPGSMTTLLAWLQANGELPSHAVPLDIGDFVIGRLCDARPRFERTQAIGLLDLQTQEWRCSAFERLAISELAWPELTGFRTCVGHIAHRGRAIPCYPCVGDQQAALAGALLREGELSLNISTGSQVSRLVRQARDGDFQTRPFFDDLWLNTITHLPAGRSLEALLSLLIELPRAEGIELRDPWGTISREAVRTSDSELEVELTFFAGSLGQRGAIRNATLDTLTVGHLFRAAFRNMASNYVLCAKRLSASSDWSRIVFSGGLVQKLPLLRDFIVERFGCSHRVCPSSEDALLGLLVLGLVVTGRAASVSDAMSHVERDIV